MALLGAERSVPAVALLRAAKSRVQLEHERGTLACTVLAFRAALAAAGMANPAISHWQIVPGALAESFPPLFAVNDIALRVPWVRDRSGFLFVRVTKPTSA